ncbi:hypothetical protein C8J57DRAFT_1418194, partial [Mycena rebaudengoi]
MRIFRFFFGLFALAAGPPPFHLYSFLHFLVAPPPTSTPVPFAPILRSSKYPTAPNFFAVCPSRAGSRPGFWTFGPLLVSFFGIQSNRRVEYWQVRWGSNTGIEDTRHSPSRSIFLLRRRVYLSAFHLPSLSSSPAAGGTAVSVFNSHFPVQFGFDARAPFFRVMYRWSTRA